MGPIQSSLNQSLATLNQYIRLPQELAKAKSDIEKKIATPQEIAKANAEQHRADLREERANVMKMIDTTGNSLDKTLKDIENLGAENKLVNMDKNGLLENTSEFQSALNRAQISAEDSERATNRYRDITLGLGEEEGNYDDVLNMSSQNKIVMQQISKMAQAVDSANADIMKRQRQKEAMGDMKKSLSKEDN